MVSGQAGAEECWEGLQGNRPLPRGVLVSYQTAANVENEDEIVVTESEADPFSIFYASEHEQQVRRAFLLVGDGPTAHDVVADAFAAVFQRWNDLDAPGPYLNRCVLNGCRDVHRLTAKVTPTEAFDDAEVAVDAADDMAELLLELPFRQRVAIVLRFYGRQSEAEIAEALGCRPGTVGSLIHRGLKTLRLSLEDER